MSQGDAKPKLKLYYFNIAAKGEPIRLALKHAGIEFEDYRFKDYAEFLAKKQDGSLQFGQVPCLEVEMGPRKAVLVQSAAILRFIAKLAPESGLYPKCPIQAAQVDAIIDQEADAFQAFRTIHYKKRFLCDGISDEVAADLKNKINETVIPSHFAALEKQLEKSKSGWLAGTEQPSIADFQWGSTLRGVSHGWTGSKTVLDAEKFPKLVAFEKKFHDFGAIKKYYETNVYKDWF